MLDEAANHQGAHGSGLRACQTKVRAEVAGELVPTPPKGLLAAEEQLATHAPRHEAARRHATNGPGTPTSGDFHVI